MWIIVLIILFLIFGRNLNLGASLTSVIQGAHESPLSSPAGTTPGIPGPSGYGNTFNAPNVPSTPSPIATSPAPIAPTPFTPAPSTIYSASPAQRTVSGIAANYPAGTRQYVPGVGYFTGTGPTAPIRTATEAPLPVTNLPGRQTSVPENGGTFFGSRVRRVL